jgi:hypothetical protein
MGGACKGRGDDDDKAEFGEPGGAWRLTACNQP